MSNHELKKPNYIILHQDIAQTPQGHISIDLIGPYNTTSQGNSYALTVIYSLTGYLTKQEGNHNSYTLVLGNNAQIWFPKNIAFKQWNRI